MQINSVQKWIPIIHIFENGIIKNKKGELIKIIKISPININLKSDTEKETILNYYKDFLKVCNFYFQILIQSNKEILSNHIRLIKEINKKEENNIKIISENYINFIQEINLKRKSSSKNFFIILKENPEKNNKYSEKNYIDKLTENSLKIKEFLTKCGNTVDISIEKKEVEEIIKSFLLINKTKEDKE